MKLVAVNGSWEDRYPVNWEFIGSVFIDIDTLPVYVEINGILYERILKG